MIKIESRDGKYVTLTGDVSRLEIYDRLRVNGRRATLRVVSLGSVCQAKIVDGKGLALVGRTAEWVEE